MHVFGQILQLEDRRATYYRSLIRSVFPKLSQNTRNYIIWSAILLAFLIGLTTYTLKYQLATNQNSLNSMPFAQTKFQPQSIADQRITTKKIENTDNATLGPVHHSISTKVITSSSTNGTIVQVNDLSIPVSTNGNFNKQITSKDGQSNVNISVNNSTNEDSSYSNVEINSSSTESNSNFQDAH